MPNRPRKSSPRRAKGCATCAKLRKALYSANHKMIGQQFSGFESRDEKIKTLIADRDEARASLEQEQKAHDTIAQFCFALGASTDDGTSTGAVRGLIEKHAKQLASLRASNATLTEDCFQIRKSRDEAEARAGEMAKERDTAVKKGSDVAFENGQLKERNAALREEIALLRANARSRHAD